MVVGGELQGGALVVKDRGGVAARSVRIGRTGGIGREREDRKDWARGLAQGSMTEAVIMSPFLRLVI